MKDVTPAVLDFSMFSLDDYVNLVLQRSDVLGTERGAQDLVRKWENGDAAPLYDAVSADPERYAQRVASMIHAEYQALEGLLARLLPKRIADIGCGYGLFDLYAYHGLGAHMLLIDIETTEERHFGFADEGAGYARLSVARAFLEANGVPPSHITTWNPDFEDLPDGAPVDLAMSLLSCGFHYPVDMYVPFFRFAVRPRGAVILDLRRGKADLGLARLRSLGKVRPLRAPSGVRRVLLKKGPDL